MIGRYAVRFASLGYLAVILVAPVGYVFWKTFEHGVAPAWDAGTTPDAVHALKVTLILTAIAVPANTIFGVLSALAIVRHRFPGAGIFNAIVDLPLALSPVVVGLALLLLYGRGGWLGGHGVAFALPGMVLATIFVSLPFVVREVVPVLREIGTEQEQAAATLGASWLQTFVRVTWPAIRWATVSVAVPPAPLTAFRGRGGGGKPPLLRVTGGLERREEGKISLAGGAVPRRPPQSRGVGFVFQHYAAFKHMTVWGNVAFGLTIRRRPRSEIKQRVKIGRASCRERV